VAGAVSLLIGGGFLGSWFGFTWSLLGDSLVGWVVSVAVAAATYGAITGYSLPSIVTSPTADPRRYPTERPEQD
jgi:hypothetical protein